MSPAYLPIVSCGEPAAHGNDVSYWLRIAALKGAGDSSRPDRYTAFDRKRA